MTRAAAIAFLLLLLLATACGGVDARPSVAAATPATTPDPAMLRDGDALLTPKANADLRAAVAPHDGAPYDFYFEWSDERIYCSELAWKAFREALGLEIGALTRFGEHDLTDPLVVAKLQERFGDEIPAEEPVISPAEMFASDLLVTVTERE